MVDIPWPDYAPPSRWRVGWSRADILVTPASWPLLKAAVWLCMIGAFVVAAVATADQFEKKRACHGAFSAAFSAAFDRYRCELTIRRIGTDFKLTLPLPPT